MPHQPVQSSGGGGGSGTDELAKVSANDTTAGYLNGKLVAGANITLTENNDGANETLTVAAAGGGGATVYTDTYANIPAAGTAGDLFLPSDSYAISRDDGADWNATWGPIFPFTKPPSIASLTWVNQGTATATEANGCLTINGPAVAPNNWRILKKSAPAVPYVFTVCLITNSRSVVGLSAGIVFRQSSDGKLVALYYNNALNDIVVAKYTNATTWSADYISLDSHPSPAMWFFRIEDDNTNRISSFSFDGQNFLVAHSVGRTDFITADEIGIAINTGATAVSNATFLSWVEA